MHEARTRLSRLVDTAAKGEPFVIARAGRPLVKVTPLTAETTSPRIGFLPDAAIPDGFDTMSAATIRSTCGTRAPRPAARHRRA
ncbi:type II toxin-antitoxin system Phd/YefM family antitoxin [Jannaschia formosa]|uniref:type II toxin-antitoxin system Phd/YefM family antitoxin n=1 Tax=Jannaschia formosa TaxID=2259592 RepID=UPI001ADDB7F5|nr:type II toxin-antitoxin system prevent-host-death family antitoxin [Jannaschia formosa]